MSKGRNKILYTSGNIINGFIFIKETNHSIRGVRHGLFKCECDRDFIAPISKVVIGQRKSCGCKANKNSFMLGNYKSSHPLYSVWAGIKQRCYNKNDKSFDRYGALGVKMCKEWFNNPQLFIEWSLLNGWDKGLQIDKDIKGNGLLYSPCTCCFVTPKENCNTRKNSRWVTYNGETKTISQWAEQSNVSSSTLNNRITKLGWTMELAMAK